MNQQIGRNMRTIDMHNSDKLFSRSTLPIFPLPFVLLPSEVSALHIFEDKYRAMLTDSIEHGTPFGICYLNEDIAGLISLDSGSIGCTADIRKVYPRDNGRSDIVIVGDRRFEINEFLDRGNPYLEADVTFFDDQESSDEKTLDSYVDQANELLSRLATASNPNEKHSLQKPEIPHENYQELSFLLCFALDLVNEDKSTVLKMRNTSERFLYLLEKLRLRIKKIEADNAKKKKDAVEMDPDDDMGLQP